MVSKCLAGIMLVGLCVSVTAAKSSAVSKPTVTSSVTADKLGQRQSSVLDSDDESLAEYMGQLSHMHTGVSGMASQVSSLLSSKVRSEVKVQLIRQTVEMKLFQSTLNITLTMLFFVVILMFSQFIRASIVHCMLSSVCGPYLPILQK